MIVFDLQCGNGHRFEGWFEDHQAFETQQAKGLISCPVCNDMGIEKLPSAFAIKSSSPRLPVSAPDPGQLAELGQRIADYVAKNFDNVGADFTKEALKIHYGASEPRNIRGVSTDEEEKLLRKEGVPFLKFQAPSKPDPDPES